MNALSIGRVPEAISTLICRRHRACRQRENPRRVPQEVSFADEAVPRGAAVSSAGADDMEVDSHRIVREQKLIHQRSHLWRVVAAHDLRRRCAFFVRHVYHLGVEKEELARRFDAAEVARGV